MGSQGKQRVNRVGKSDRAREENLPGGWRGFYDPKTNARKLMYGGGVPLARADAERDSMNFRQSYKAKTSKKDTSRLKKGK